MKIQPIDFDPPAARAPLRSDSSKTVVKTRWRKLFDRPFPSVLRNSSAEKPIAGVAAEFEPSTVCLSKMVQNFLEENNEKHSSMAAAAKIGRNRCNCFNGNSNDSSDDESDDLGDSVATGSFGADISDKLKNLILCASVIERNLLADTAKFVEKNSKIQKRKADLRKIVTDGLASMGYNCSICQSKWNKSSSCPAGKYEYIDVMVEGERFLIDIDFRSEFEIARSTKTYKAVLQLLPNVFVGKPDRLGQILSIVSEAAKQSLKKKGMHLPPWRKAEYMKAKWLSSHIRITPVKQSKEKIEIVERNENENEEMAMEIDCGEFELIFGDETIIIESESDSIITSPPIWKLPAIKQKSVDRETKIVTGLASIFKENP